MHPLHNNQNSVINPYNQTFWHPSYGEKYSNIPKKSQFYHICMPKNFSPIYHTLCRHTTKSPSYILSLIWWPPCPPKQLQQSTVQLLPQPRPLSKTLLPIMHHYPHAFERKTTMLIDKHIPLLTFEAQQERILTNQEQSHSSIINRKKTNVPTTSLASMMSGFYGPSSTQNLSMLELS